jgi:DNA replication initiation complex subunit (GINS family)
MEQKEIPLLTFNSLFNLNRVEKKESSLQNIDPLFYEALVNFIKIKEKEILDLKSQENLDKLKKEERILKNSKRIAKDIITIRTQKISEMAIKNYFFGEEIFSKEDIIINKEKEFYDKVFKSLSLFKDIQ